jgi:hypothetical protein
MNIASIQQEKILSKQKSAGRAPTIKNKAKK